ncbi:hypothetical protein PLICRDRAFT_176607 [Plicaturopsis crispa FD-325 SS-3]|nr:hypothetical protein PLICRDRAFT_176607 [Plicaturopsis crispa FD-325 SS-3]
MSFFGKAPSKPAAASTKTPAPTNASKHRSTPSAGSSSALRTPESKGKDDRALNSSAVASPKSSDAGSSTKDTPPTSDAIDVDMMSADEDEDAKKRAPAKSTRVKRKIVVEDSDDDLEASRVKKKPSNYKEASPERKGKKPRVSAIFSDDDEDEDMTTSSFSKRLTHFKKSPAKSGHSRSTSAASADDDDFIVPSDSEMTTASRPSSRLSHRSSAMDSDDSDEDRPKKKKTAPRPTAKKHASGSGGGSTAGTGNFSLLTQAEQREQGKKNEKKATEDPFGFLVDVRDKDGVKPGQPGYDPRTLYIPKKAWAEFTPFEKQFWEIKQNHFDTVLFFQKGKFLELYEDDARIGHQEFDLKLTQRVKMSMVGVPEMSFNFWAAKFLGKGYKVGRVDQAETALGAEMRIAADKVKGTKARAEDKGKEKIVRRELNKVYTNGTLVDEELLTDEQAGHCMSLREVDEDGNSSFGVCVLDSATSEFQLSAFEDDVCRTKLETLIRQLRVKEIIFMKGNLTVATTRLLKAILPAACLWTSLRESEGFGFEQTLKELNAMYSQGDDEVMDDDDVELIEEVPQSIRDMVGCRDAMEALGSMVWYLRQLNIDKDIMSMKNFNIYDPMKKGQGLVLDGQTLAHIEVLLNNEGTADGSLLKLLERAVTPFGKRLFRIWLCMPLREAADINARLDAVQDIMNHPTFEADFANVAKGLPDLERIVSRIHAKNCKVKDFLKVLKAFGKLSNGIKTLATTSEDFKSKTILGLLRSAPDLSPNIKHVQAMYLEHDDDAKGDELLPRDGKDKAYDDIMEEIHELEKELDGELKKMKNKLGCKDLSYWHSAQGNKEIYLVQTKPGMKGVPKDWIKSGGTKALNRWVVPSLQTTVRSLKEARENRNSAIKSFKYRVFDEFDADRSVWLRAIRVFAELDCLFSLAKSSSAIGEPACRPEFVEGDSAWFEFQALRHPALSARPGGSDFIPNDVKLGGDKGRIALLTGPNMGGKSTVMRMTAAGVIMAQLGMLVPAERARLCPVDAILTRMGAYDNMFSNASTFKVELDECCKILRDATPKSLVILDELGRGTSTYDGMAIAGAVLHQLATHTLPLSFFATHYGSLTDDFAYHPNIRNMHMATLVDDEKRELVFLYKLVEGVAASSFGTHVANLAGVPMDVVKRAEIVSDDFARKFKEKLEDKQKKAATHKLPLVAQADFAYLYGIATGKIAMPEDPVRQREVLRRLKGTVRKYVQG